jgi:hypothetical protein
MLAVVSTARPKRCDAATPTIRQCGKRECRGHVTNARLQRGTRCLPHSPVAPPRQDDDRNPMVGNDGVEDADRSDGGEQDT